LLPSVAGLAVTKSTTSSVASWLPSHAQKACSISFVMQFIDFTSRRSFAGIVLPA